MAKKRILITGGASGIGAATAARAQQDGYEVIVIDREGGDICADLSDPEQTAQALNQALRDGPITRLVNNVGVVFPASIENQTLAEFDKSVALNLRCAFQCTQALIPGMKQQKFGRVVNIASRAALGKVLRSAYAATKAGLVGMTRTWALELSGNGITINAIGPGPIKTALFSQGTPDSAATRAYLDSIPVKRMGTPEDVAHAASYFLDERSGFVTGQVLYVCGGLTVGTGSV